MKAADELNLSLENSTGLTTSEILSAKTFLGESYFRIASYYADVTFDNGESPRKSTLGRRYLEKAIQCMDTFSVGDESQYFLVRKISFLKSYGYIWEAMLTIENAKQNGIQNEAIFEMEGAIWLFLGRRSSAGLAYENWIKLMRKHKVDFQIERESHSSTLIDDLNDLFDLTGHPNNLPTSWKTK